MKYEFIGDVKKISTKDKIEIINIPFFKFCKLFIFDGQIILCLFFDYSM